MERDSNAQRLLAEIEEKFKLLETEQDTQIKQDYYRELATLRAVVKGLNEKGKNLFWKILTGRLRNKYTSQYAEMKLIWQRYEDESARNKQKLASGQHLQPGGTAASTSTSTLMWPNASTLSLAQPEGNLKQQVLGPQQHPPAIDRPIWVAADYQRDLADQPPDSIAAQGPTTAPGPMMGQRGPHSLAPAPRSPSGQQSRGQADPSLEDPGQQYPGACHRRLASDVTFTAVGGPLSSIWDIPRTSGESDPSSQDFNAPEYQVDPITGNPVFARASKSSEGHHAHGY